MNGSMPNTAGAESRFDEIHSRIQAKLDEVHADLKQLATDLREANQESARARKDRIAGIKRELIDLGVTLVIAPQKGSPARLVQASFGVPLLAAAKIKNESKKTILSYRIG